MCCLLSSLLHLQQDAWGAAEHIIAKPADCLTSINHHLTSIISAAHFNQHKVSLQPAQNHTPTFRKSHPNRQKDSHICSSFVYFRKVTDVQILVSHWVFLLSWGKQVINILTLQKKGLKALGLDLNVRNRLQEMTIFIVFHTSMKADEIFCISDTNNIQ